MGLNKSDCFLFDLNGENIIWEFKSDNSSIIIDGEIVNDEAIIVETALPKFLNNKWTYDNIRVLSKNKVGIETNILKEDNSAQLIKLNIVEDNLELILDKDKSSLIQIN